MNKDPNISTPVIGLYSNINPIIMATKGSKLDSTDAFEASTCRILLFQISVAMPCTTTAVPINRAQSVIFELIRKGVPSEKANGIDTIKPTRFEYNVIVNGSILCESTLVIIIIIANVIIVTTIHISPLSKCNEDPPPITTTQYMPMIARIDPNNIRIVNFSFKKKAANKPVKIGVIAKMMADVVGSAVCKPLKKDH